MRCQQGCGPDGGATMDIVADGPTLVLSGNFHGRSTAEVRSALRAAAGLAGARQIVVDLSGVGLVDVPALRVLAFASQRGRPGAVTTSPCAGAAPPYAGCCT